MIAKISWLLFALSLTFLSLPAQIIPVSGGHSHNDYYQERPLFEALENRMVSIEADVFLRDGELLVGHSTRELSPDLTLSSLYLDPLYHQISLAGSPGKTVILMIDIKDRGADTYRRLQQVIEPYASVLTKMENGRLIIRPITLILSGDRPFELIRQTQNRYVFIDGRLDDLANDYPSELYPLISDNWNKWFKWRGRGAITSEEKKKLIDYVNQCHEQNKLIRFWGLPKDPTIAGNFWTLFKETGVDLIVNDCPSCFYHHFNSGL